MPDLIVLAEPLKDGDTVWHSAAAVALAIEIVSTGSERTDRWFKPLEYAQAGIPWFWRVEPDGIVVQFRLVDGQYVEHARVPLGDLLAGGAPDLSPMK